MANEELLGILGQGRAVWNEWREKNRDTKIDFSGIILQGFDLSGVDFRGADLREAWLTGADLSRVDLMNSSLCKAHLFRVSLRGADLREADLHGAILSGADLSGANLSNADCTTADLIGADLTMVDFTGANLSKANIREAVLEDVNLDRAELNKADFTGAILNDAHLRGIDLSCVIGLNDVTYDGPSSISTDTFVASKGEIPRRFLRGCGLSDWEIEVVNLYDPDLTNDERNEVLYRIYDLQSSQSIQISPLFISYSRADGEFVDKIGNALTKKGIRYWQDIHGMKAGRVEKQIDRAIRQNPIVLLILSDHSLSSDWVEHEVRIARALEKEMGRDVLCPIALDDSWKDSRWPKRVMEQIMEYNILDFSKWKDDSQFDGMFRKLIDGLELFYRG